MASFVGGETLEEYLLLLFESAVLLPGLIFRLVCTRNIEKHYPEAFTPKVCVCVALCTGIEDEEEYDDDDDDDGVDDDVGDAEKW